MIVNCGIPENEDNAAISWCSGEMPSTLEISPLFCSFRIVPYKSNPFSTLGSQICFPILGDIGYFSKVPNSQSMLLGSTRRGATEDVCPGSHSTKHLGDTNFQPKLWRITQKYSFLV